MKLNFAFLLSFIFASVTIAQKNSFSVTIDKDTLYQDEFIKIEFVLDNMNGNFKAPDFAAFRIVSGPNVSSNFTMINGEINQKKSYSYALVPLETGNIQIGKATVENEQGIIYTDPIDIVVLGTELKDQENLSQKRNPNFGTESKTKINNKTSNRVMKKI